MIERTRVARPLNQRGQEADFDCFEHSGMIRLRGQICQHTRRLHLREHRMSMLAQR